MRTGSTDSGEDGASTLHVENADEVAAESCFLRGEFGEAERLLLRLIASGDADSTTYFNLGLTRVELGDDHGAIAAFSKSTEAHPESFANRGLSYERIGDLASAQSDYEMALEYNPADTAALTNLGTLRMSLGDVQSAKSLLRRAAKDDPTANWQLSDVYLATGDYVRARSLLQRAVSAGESRALVDLAILATIDGDLRQSDEILERAAAAGIDVDSEEIASLLTPLHSDINLRAQVRLRLQAGEVRTTLADLVRTVIEESIGDD